ncbi:hypothetical protein FQN49_001280 [Arthroderma sp. PD_2]|nr:hypothetical protein FQN49_001280 [Arthroderma sp. PD_2]
MFVFSFRNGFVTLVQDLISSKSLPGTDQKLRTEMTGSEILDRILPGLLVFFWPVVDGSAPGLSLQALNFTGSVTAIWILVELECSRKVNRMGILKFPVIFGLLAQMATFGVIMPLFFAIHLVTSLAVLRPTAKNTSIPIHELWCLPLSMALGFLLPTLAMSLPESLTEPLFSKQAAIAFWQPWPLWMYFIHVSLSKAASLFAACGTVDTATQRRRTRTALRYVYSFAFASAAVPHLLTWSISLSACLFPMLFESVVRPALEPRNAFFNTLPWSSASPSSVGEGSLWFLQWDQLTGTVAALAWAIRMYIGVHAARKLRVCGLGLAVKTGLICLVSGYAGAAVELLWERDELVWESALVEEQKKA